MDSSKFKELQEDLIIYEMDSSKSIEFLKNTALYKTEHSLWIWTGPFYKIF